MSGKAAKQRGGPAAATDPASVDDLVSLTKGLALDEDHESDVVMQPAEQTAPSTKQNQKEKQKGKGKAAGGKPPPSAADDGRERFDLDEDAQEPPVKPQVKQQQPQPKQQSKPQAKQQAAAPAGPRRPPSPAHIEEITSSNEDEDDEESDAQPQQQQARKRKIPSKVPVLPPKAGSNGAGGAAMSAMQRKAMQQRNKNGVKGLDGKMEAAALKARAKAALQHKKGGAVEIEDDDEDDEDEDGGLIDEEELEERAWRRSQGELSDSDAGSNSDEDGIEWETPAQRRAKKEAAARAAAAAAAGGAPAASSRCPSFKTVLVWLGVLSLLCALAWVRLQDSSLWHAGDADDLVSQPPSEAGGDLYAVLGVERTASLKDIKTAYRRAVLSTHPDKNPSCTDCVERFQRVQKAYDTLSHADKRSMYDSIETTFDLLASEAVELTAATFDNLVTQRDDVWVIEVYTDWHKSAIRFSAAWEEAVQRYGGFVRFGRVHAQREQSLARTFPTKFGVIPSVLIHADGQFRGTKAFRDGSASALPKLARWIGTHYPNVVESVSGEVDSIKEFMTRGQKRGSDVEQAAVLFVPDFKKNLEQARKQQPSAQRGGGSHQQRFQQQMLQTDIANRINEPTLALKSLARRFQSAFTFGQVAQIEQPDQWKSWIKQVSAAFKLTPPSSLPALLYQEDPSSAPVWLSGGAAELNKDKLMAHLDTLHRRRVPWFDSHAYARHCSGDSASNKESGSGSSSGSSKRANTCVLALQCVPLKIPVFDFAVFTSSARSVLRSSGSSVAKNARLQFAKVDATGRQSDLGEPLCAALPEADRAIPALHYVAIMEQEPGQGNWVLVHTYVDGPAPLDAWLQRVLKRDGNDEAAAGAIPAPFVPVLHIADDVLPVYVPGMTGGPHLLVPLRWLYVGGLVLALWLLAPLISRHFSSFLQIIFALSIAVPAFELLRDLAAKYS
jgi:curved DNA-binding protein CbpA